MNDRESFHITKDDNILLNQAKRRESELGKEQRIYDRTVKLKRNEIQIENIKRAIEDKKRQITENDYTEKTDLFIDEKKPAYLLKNEIDMMAQQNWELEDSNQKMKEEQEKDEEEDKK